jgi:hypothetical protein
MTIEDYSFDKELKTKDAFIIRDYIYGTGSY